MDNLNSTKVIQAEIKKIDKICSNLLNDKKDLPKLSEYRDNLSDCLEVQAAIKQEIKEGQNKLKTAKSEFAARQAKRNLDEKKIKLDDFNKKLNQISKLIKSKEKYGRITDECKQINQRGKIEQYINGFKSELKNAKTYSKYREILRLKINNKRMLRDEIKNINEKNNEVLERKNKEIVDNPPNLDNMIDDLKKGLRALIGEGSATEEQIKSAKKIKDMIDGKEDGKNEEIKNMINKGNKELHEYINGIDKEYKKLLEEESKSYTHNIDQAKSLNENANLNKKNKFKKDILKKSDTIRKTKSDGDIQKVKKSEIIRKTKSDGDIQKVKKYKFKLKGMLASLVKVKMLTKYKISNLLKMSNLKLNESSFVKLFNKNKNNLMKNNSNEKTVKKDKTKENNKTIKM